MDDIADIMKRGAEARAHGSTLMDNPFMHSDAMPAATGEPLEAWVLKYDAWKTGFMIENAMKGGCR